MQEVLPGSVVASRYRIVSCLGRGGMGSVYLAARPSSGDSYVAIKVLSAALLGDQIARERFAREIVSASRISHNNVLKVGEYLDLQGVPAYVMEYAEDGSLAEQMRKRRYRWIEVADILSQISAGLSAIHGAGLIHRDLKPHNLLLGGSGQIKISDFGVAISRGQIGLSPSGKLVGTPKYVAPEYVETGECSERSDIYALGVIGYELLAGESPFAADSREAILMERFHTRPEKLYDLAPHSPEELVAIVARAMSVDPAERYGSSADMQAAIRSLRSDPLSSQLSISRDPEQTGEFDPAGRSRPIPAAIPNRLG